MGLYIWDMHVQLRNLDTQVTELRTDLCTYQMITTAINDKLALAGVKPIVVPPPQHCPPP